MKKIKSKQLLENFIKIRNEATTSNDGNRCMIAPHPDLKKQLDQEIDRIKRENENGVLANRIRLGTNYRPVGFNDGLIYPGSMFPVGTGAEAARSAALNRAPLSGTVRVIVVLVDFSDKVMTKTKLHFEDLFFSLGKVATGSVREYFREVTRGIIDIQGQVVGPYRMPLKLSQYANGASGTGSATPNARTMAKSAAVAANPTVNFTPYDNDSDGFVDAFIVIHAGSGAEVTGSVNDIWSHKWVLDAAYTADGTTKIYGYLTVPEDCRLGVCAHELGHLLFGFPDLYDTDGSSEGIGNWCLMAGGSWNNGGNTPAHPSAWCKTKQNWVATVVQTTNQNAVPIEDVKSGHKVYKLWKNGAPGTEYFLVENRQKIKFDKFIPESGLLIWHIDDATTSNTNESHYKVALEQADGLKQMEANANRGDAGDVYPGSTNKRTFDNASTPNSKSYAGNSTCVSVSNISNSGPVMKADLKVKCIVKVKEVTKDIVKDKELAKERTKDTKELSKELTKEFVLDKSVAADKIPDKTFVEKPGEKLADKTNEGGFGHMQGGSGFQQGAFHQSNIEERLSNLEAQLGFIQPFISQALRPDLSHGALQNEEEEKEEENSLESEDQNEDNGDPGPEYGQQEGQEPNDKSNE